MDAFKRWRMVLGTLGEAQDRQMNLNAEQVMMDRALDQVFEGNGKKASLADSSPSILQWMKDIRNLFPKDSVRLLQKEAIDKFGIERFLIHPSTMRSIEPDASLVSTLIALKDSLSDPMLNQAKTIVNEWVEKLLQRLSLPIQNSWRKKKTGGTRGRVFGGSIDWPLTIRKNLRHYQPSVHTIIPEKWYFKSERAKEFYHIILLIDQSGSMLESAVHAGLMSSMIARLPSVEIDVIAFDVELADITSLVSRPGDLLFGLHMGGGTDITKALEYARSLVVKPDQTFVFLISDLYDASPSEELAAQASGLVECGAHMLVLLSLHETGIADYDKENARLLARLGIPSLAATPDQFPELFASWVHERQLRT